MALKEDIVEYYRDLCVKNNNKYVSRDGYLKLNPKYGKKVIVKLWGSWTNFMHCVNNRPIVNTKEDPNVQSKMVAYYIDLCVKYGEKLSRTKYTSLDTEYTRSAIEKEFGSWNMFLEEVNKEFGLNRVESVKKFNKDVNKVVITYAIDGTAINVDFLQTLELYCKKNNAELGVIWGKSTNKKAVFSLKVYELLKPYLATEFRFEKDKGCIVKDFAISSMKRNPLLNLDKLSTKINTIIAGSTKQYLRVLPYKQENDYRLGCSTGTISIPEYKCDVNGYMNEKYHKFGALLLEYNNEYGRYIVRNLTFEDSVMYDLNKKYTPSTVKTVNRVPAMILGDLHLPDEDNKAVKRTHEEFNLLCPNDVIVHDLASWNSISHHELTKYYTRCKNKTPVTMTLETELKEVLKHIEDFTKGYNNINFHVVNSNHDLFIEKWLDDGDFIKDVYNARIGAKLFIDYLDNKNILTDKLPNNVSFMEKNKSFKICGYELAEHGDAGISGAKGSVNSFNKSFDKIVIGHTHSPEIFEQTVVVGTLSKLKLCYNQKGMTMWAQANVVLHENGTFQMLFI